MNPLSTVTNPRGATTSYTYSADDLLEATTDALGHVWSFTHDAAGNTLSSLCPTGETVSRTYTPDDLLATSAYSTGESYAFSYTPTHRLSSVTDQAGRAQSFAYNPVGWLTSASDTSGGQPFATTYAYDAAGQVTSLDSAAAPAVAYAYDLAGRLTSLTLPGSGAATFTHDAAGARTGVTLPNGALTAFGYDPAGRIESIVTTATSGLIAESYTRDAAGRVTSDSQGSYAYDDARRLATWTSPSGATIATYTYDAASNLTGVSVDGSATVSFEVDAADRITSRGFTYDEAGNLTSDGTRTFAYDAACRLVSVKDAATGTTIAAYTYDAFNRRVSATEGTETVFFHYDGASARVIAETDGAGATIAAYTYDSGGALFSMTRGGATYFYRTNARGDVVAMSDSQGDVVNTYTYDPWGAPLTASETVENPYRYASYRYDTSTGLYYCWNRYYAPELARFLTRDIYPGELSDPVTMNPYLYCGGDPVNAVDPSGMTTIDTGRYVTGQAFGAGYSQTSWWCVDQFGTDAGYETYEYVGGAIPAMSAGRMVGVSNAPTALDRDGVASGGGLSCDIGGFDSAAARAHDGSLYGSLALQAGPGAVMTGAEVHGTVSWTVLKWHVYLPDLILGYGSSVTPVPAALNSLASHEI